MRHRVIAWAVGAVAFVVGLIALLAKSGALTKLAASTAAAKHEAEARGARAEEAAADARARAARSDAERLHAQSRAFDAKMAAEEAARKRDAARAVVSADIDDAERARRFNEHWKSR